MIEINNKVLSNYKFIDLFCGIGGFHYALSSFGAECVFACDIDKNVVEAYENNFGFKPECCDIAAYDKTQIPHHDIICAGFPCQPFSISGTKAGFEDKKTGKLFFQIIEIATIHKPKLIILENVANFRKHNEGETLRKTKAELEQIGYDVFYKILCASDFGVPQSRRRIYIVCFRKDLNVANFAFPSPIEQKTFLRDVIISDDENSIKGNYFITKEYQIRKNENTSKGLLRIGEIGQGRQGERIYSIDGNAITLSSQGGGLGGKTGMYLINQKVRKLYPRECARLMGFPDDYKLSPTQEQNYRQFGNSVVIDVLQYILKEIIDVLGEKL